jgi:hypothetical protein
VAGGTCVAIRGQALLSKQFYHQMVLDLMASIWPIYLVVSWGMFAPGWAVEYVHGAPPLSGWLDS